MLITRKMCSRISSVSVVNRLQTGQPRNQVLFPVRDKRLFFAASGSQIPPIKYDILWASSTRVKRREVMIRNYLLLESSLGMCAATPPFPPYVFMM
jgi:hypothetical protein